MTLALRLTKEAASELNGVTLMLTLPASAGAGVAFESAEPHALQGQHQSNIHPWKPTSWEIGRYIAGKINIGRLMKIRPYHNPPCFKGLAITVFIPPAMLTASRRCPWCWSRSPAACHALPSSQSPRSLSWSPRTTGLDLERSYSGSSHIPS